MSSNNTRVLNFNDCMSLIIANGKSETYMLGGEMGIGKSAIAKSIAAKIGYDYAYLDMANMSLGDTSMPVVNRDTRCTEYFPNEVLKLHTGRPVVLMVDEFTKASREAQNMILPIPEARRLGSTLLHPDSIVIASGNMPNEGLGDKILPHQSDRFVLLTMRKPTDKEWINWAAENDIDPVVMAFVDQFPQVMQSYHDDPGAENKYIFHPKVQRSKVVTPRSLEKASNQLKNKELVSDNAMYAAMEGTLGQAGAADLMSFVNMSESLPTLTQIVDNPLGTKIPDSIASRILLTYNLVMRVDKDTLDPVMKFVERKEGFPDELQALFINKLLSTPSKAQWAAIHKTMAKHVIRLQHVFNS